MGLRLLLVFLVIWAIALIVRTLMRNNTTQKTTNKVRTTPDQLRQCGYCGVHCPEDSTFRYQDKAFCSKAHLDQYFQYQDDKPDDE